jgi:hypothetical protein
MSIPAVVTTGQDWILPVQLVEDGVAVNLTGDTIKAAVTDRTGALVIAAVTADPLHADADLANGIAVPVFAAADTLGLESAIYLIEVQRTHGTTVTTWPRQMLQVQVGVI